MPGTDVVIVFVTTPGKEPALALARQVVEESLAACGNVIPNVTSVFRWDEKVNVEEEVKVEAEVKEEVKIKKYH